MAALQFERAGFPGEQTNWVPAGSCQTYNVPDGGPQQATNITIVGKYNTNDNQFWVGALTSSASSPGLKVAATGTTTSPSWKYLYNG
ncbi:hypothetical protein [Dactylosporangium darangshiense]|uniref:Uncharacterized protein n=1 Tax=Dactylosporangium darangshiense TaxID=579108 RepID=A0ABP8DVT8_9ACTN